AAYLIYAITFGQVYTFQTAVLVMEWTNGSTGAFSASQSQGLTGNTISYFVVSTAIYAAGFGLVTLGHWLRNRRRSAAASAQPERHTVSPG
ncbi:hypothetical protein, partial [Actinomadura sp. SCN-SB]|uniref:hypothetical protein n=1 Tax=Actinomadura sp. SCN-SB TaxID=3373092 RepID=UPI003753A5FD